MKKRFVLFVFTATLMFALSAAQRPASAATAAPASCSIMALHSVAKATVISYAPRTSATTNFRLAAGQRFYVCTNPIPAIDPQWVQFFLAPGIPMLYVPIGTFN